MAADPEPTTQTSAPVVKRRPVAAPADELEDKPAVPAYFCLEAGHPGQSTPRADQFDFSRMFHSADTGAPTCPLCRKQVSAIPVDDTSTLPPSIQAIKTRLDIAERNR